MPAELVTRERLIELTGTRQPKRMVAWLEARAWVFEPPARRGDVPKVSVAYFEARMSGKPLPDPVGQRRREDPALDWLTSPS